MEKVVKECDGNKIWLENT